jgi:UDP-glucose 4-epimerase
MEVLAAFGRAAGRDIHHEVAPRRRGDIAEFYANTDKSKLLLNWQAMHSLNDMCESVWRWQSQNPKGYSE